VSLPHRGEQCRTETQGQVGPQDGVTGMPRPSFDRKAIEAEIVRVRSLGLDELRTLWRITFRSSPPPAFSKDLMTGSSAAGIDPETAKHLDGLARGDKPGADHPRRLKPGIVLLREYQGERHTVTVVPNGYVWHETTYASLSIIARAITGTSWNGPRFFGLRSGVEPRTSSEAANVSPAPNNKRRLIRAVMSHPAPSPLVGDGERRP
jgi:Protein of unknown function (DUF2924)